MTGATGVTVLDAKQRRVDYPTAKFWTVTEAGTLHLKAEAIAASYYVASYASGSWLQVTTTETHDARHRPAARPGTPPLADFVPTPDV